FAAQRAERDAGAREHAADAAERRQRQDPREDRCVDKAVVFTRDLTVDDPLARCFRDLPRNGHASPDDVIGDVEKVQSRTEVIRAEGEVVPPALVAGAEAQLTAVPKPGVDMRDLPLGARPQQLSVEVVNLALRPNNQTAHLRVYLQRRI